MDGLLIDVERLAIEAGVLDRHTVDALNSAMGQRIFKIAATYTMKHVADVLLNRYLRKVSESN